MKYADWVPREAIVTWDSFLKPGLEKRVSVPFPDIDEKDVYIDDRYQDRLIKLSIERCRLALDKIPTLFTSFTNGPDAKKLWDAVVSSEHYTPHEFICAVDRAYTGPFLATELMTDSNRKKWRKKVGEKSMALCSLLGSTMLDNYLAGHQHNLYQSVLNFLDDEGIVLSEEAKVELSGIFSDPPLMTSVLAKLESAAGENVKDWLALEYGASIDPIYLSKPRDPDAHRAYFIRSITNFFGEKTGRPQRSLVETLVFCLFGEIDRRKIVHTAPWLDNKS